MTEYSTQNCPNGTTARLEYPAIKLSHLIFSHHVNIGFYRFLYSFIRQNIPLDSRMKELGLFIARIVHRNNLFLFQECGVE